MRPVGTAVIIAPRAGHGRNVFRPEAARLAALHDVPDERVILFDDDARPAARFAFVLFEIRRIVATLPAGERVGTVFILRHGFPRGGQEGVSTANIGDMIDAFGGRLARAVNWVLFSCSNAATIGRHPDGDMSLADETRDALCHRGYVDCQVYGHLIAGHATLLIADRAGGTWRPLARWFRGEGRPEGGTGGEEVLPRGHALLDDLYRLVRKSVDPDDDGPEPATGFRFLVPLMESRDELVAYVQRFADVRAETGAADAPTVLELQTALARGGYDPGPLDGLAGRRTTSAVKAFQRAHPPLVVDGDAGPATWRVLRAAGLLA